MRVSNWLPVLLVLILAGCTNEENSDSVEREDTTAYFFDYRVWGDEGNPDMNILLQFRKDDELGMGQLIEPGKVELDGIALQPDSARYTGAFYELQVPFESFEGEHTISYTSPSGSEFKETFRFRPLMLTEPIPAVMSRGDWILELAGTEAGDKVRIIAIDTSFDSNDINIVETLHNGRVVLEREDLSNLVNGPIYLEIIREVEREVSEGTPAGGRFSLSYGLKREFELRD